MFAMFWVANPNQSVAHIIICCSKAMLLTLPPPTSEPDAEQAVPVQRGPQPGRHRPVLRGTVESGR